jgi:hypothetical protein
LNEKKTELKLATRKRRKKFVTGNKASGKKSINLMPVS